MLKRCLPKAILEMLQELISPAIGLLLQDQRLLLLIQVGLRFLRRARVALLEDIGLPFQEEVLVGVDFSWCADLLGLPHCFDELFLHLGPEFIKFSSNVYGRCSDGRLFGNERGAQHFYNFNTST